MKKQIEKLYRLLVSKNETITASEIAKNFATPKNSVDFRVLNRVLNDAREYYYEYLANQNISSDFLQFLIENDNKAFQLFRSKPDLFKVFCELKTNILSLNYDNAEKLLSKRDLQISVEREIALFYATYGKYEIKILDLMLNKKQKCIIAIHLKISKPELTRELILQEANNLLADEINELEKKVERSTEDEVIGLQIEKENHIKREFITPEKEKELNSAIKNCTKELAVLNNLPLHIIEKLGTEQYDKLKESMQNALSIRKSELIYSDSLFKKGTSLQHLESIIYDCKKIVKTAGIKLPSFNVPVVFTEGENAIECIELLQKERENLKSKKKFLEHKKKRLLQNEEYRKALKYNGFSEIKRKQVIKQYNDKISHLKHEFEEIEKEFDLLFK